MGFASRFDPRARWSHSAAAVPHGISKRASLAAHTSKADPTRLPDVSAMVEDHRSFLVCFTSFTRQISLRLATCDEDMYERDRTRRAAPFLFLRYAG